MADVWPTAGRSETDITKCPQVKGGAEPMAKVFLYVALNGDVAPLDLQAGGLRCVRHWASNCSKCCGIRQVRGPLQRYYVCPLLAG